MIKMTVMLTLTIQITCTIFVYSTVYNIIDSVVFSENCFKNLSKYAEKCTQQYSVII